MAFQTMRVKHQDYYQRRGPDLTKDVAKVSEPTHTTTGGQGLAQCAFQFIKVVSCDVTVSCQLTICSTAMSNEHLYMNVSKGNVCHN